MLSDQVSEQPCPAPESARKSPKLTARVNSKPNSHSSNAQPKMLLHSRHPSSPSSRRLNPATKPGDSVSIGRPASPPAIVDTSPCSARLLKFLGRCGFVIGAQLSSGSFSRVFRGQYKSRNAAVKIVDLANAAEEFRTKFFPRELYALRMLSHPHIIATYDVLSAENRIFIFMELAERGDILEYVRQNGAIPESRAKIWFKQVCQALQYVHVNGFAHRDLKSENILLDSKLNAKLTDFGFSRLCYDFDAQVPLYSETYCGSSAYVAPEVLKGEPYNAMLSDIWSLGVVLYVMLNDALPFDDSNLNRMMKRQMRRKFSFSRAVKLTEPAQQIIKSMLEPELKKRTHLESLINHVWLKKVPSQMPLDNEN